MKKNIKLEYYRSNIINNGQMEIINLQDTLDDLYFQIQSGRVIRYEFNNEIAKISSLFYHEDINCFHLVFERLRDFNLPVKSSFERESDIIDLEDDEFIGEEVSLLYDVNNCVFMIQRNRDSLSPTALEMFLNDIHNNFINQNSNLEINPILEQNTLQQVLDSNQVRKINIRVDDLGQETEYEDDLSNITEEMTRFEASSLEFTLSVGRERESEMNEGRAKNFIRTIMGRRNVSKAQVYVRTDEESNVEKYDLIEQKMYSIASFDYRENRTIRPDAVFQRMIEIYIGENNDGMRGRIQRM
ncbi:DUF6731 family protein [Gracilibacillus lacisalsi]|uniref:DUF6731 family protein n=1 Tax=Gracilibacillus lacisalsi TaxID=393087 RepID=UPI00035E3F59|nr:DUF6731 family protein [Gracilibacillus lacisalsi]